MTKKRKKLKRKWKINTTNGYMKQPGNMFPGGVSNYIGKLKDEVVRL